MPSTDEDRSQTVSRSKPKISIIEEILSDLERLVETIAADGKLEHLIALACKKAQAAGFLSGIEPRPPAHQGVRAAVEVYADWERTEERLMDMDVRPNSGTIEPPTSEPEILPLSLAGKWIAWSSDGMRIIASSETSEEAERIAIATGEPEPILQRHPGRYRP